MKALFATLFILAATYQADAEEAKIRDWGMSHATLEEIIASYDQITQILGPVSQESKVELFEGLPHPREEPKLLAAESKRGISFEDHGFLFYMPASRITEPDTVALRRILRLEKNYGRFKGFKMCGGYHPDFLIRLSGESGIVSFQICFGCGEARIFKGAQIVHCDLAGESFTFLKAILEDYYLERPDKKPVEQVVAPNGP
jgi:hypothetical protein